MIDNNSHNTTFLALFATKAYEQFYLSTEHMGDPELSF